MEGKAAGRRGVSTIQYTVVVWRNDDEIAMGGGVNFVKWKEDIDLSRKYSVVEGRERRRAGGEQ